jgi:hypothetical protein
MTLILANLRHATKRAIIAVSISAIVSMPTLGQEAGERPDEAAKLPVERVVLFTSGVGYYEHHGSVEGDSSIDLKFRVDDINDLLKSMVVQDLGGGRVSTVTYGSRDPITKTLQTFAIDLTSDPTLGQLLTQIRGERVEIDAPTRIRGTIVGVEKQQKSVGEHQIIEIELLTLLTNEGLRRIPLDGVGRIKLADGELDAELQQALAVLATSHWTDKKSVSLQFLGEGEREVRVGYIAQSPIWKTSYRLVLDDEDKPFLQGWAIVQNTTETDWQDVRLSLVSGRPISFVMDLYSPLYVPRPEVVPELYASLRPQIYAQDLLTEEEKSKSESRSLDRLPRSKESVDQEPAAATAGRPAAGVGGAISDAHLPQRYSMFGFDPDMLARSVQATAQGAEVGELFQYDIENPVTLPRQRSAMLPIINQPIEGRKVSIYNASVHAQHPLDGFELKNTSKLHLMQGPMTVFDDSVYAGDARIPDLPPGNERLLSYALDLDIEVAPTSDARPQHVVGARIEKGVLFATFKQSRNSSYTLRNSGDKAKQVLVEHPIDARWDLLSPEPTERARDVYRFTVEVKPKDPANLKIEEEQIIRQTVAITNLNDAAIQIYLSAEVSDAVKEALREVARRKGELTKLQRRHKPLELEIVAISQEQERIRNNMQAIDRNTDLYNRYVMKLAEQEDQIERLREEIRELERQLGEGKQSLDEYLSTLTLP